MLLKQLIRELPVKTVEGPLEREVTGIVYDSRRVTPGMMYVAIPGEEVSGNELIPDAVDRGAVAVVCEDNGFVPRRATRINVASARAALARAAAAYYQHPSEKLRVIGLGGRQGGTAVGFFLKQVLQLSGIHAGLLGSVRDEVQGRVFSRRRGELESLEIQHMLSGMARAGCSACVLEVPAHPREAERLLGVDFDAGVFVDLGGTSPEVDSAQTEEGWFREVVQRGMKAGATWVDVTQVGGRAEGSREAFKLTVRVGNSRTWVAKVLRLELGPRSSRAWLEVPGGMQVVEVPLTGRHNVCAAVAAFGVGSAFGVSDSALSCSLRELQPVPGRLEAVDCGQPFGVYVDSGRTEQSLGLALGALREVGAGRLLVVVGAAGGGGELERAALGRVAARMANFSVLTSDNSRNEAPAVIAGQIVAGYEPERPDGFRVVLDRRDAIAAAIRMALPGDSVLLAGKGHETYQEFENTVVPFDDRFHARDVLGALGWDGRRAL